MIRDQILDYIDLDIKDAPSLEAMTPTQLLTQIGIKPVNNAQAKECGSVLRQVLGPPKRINGRDKWRIPVKGESKFGFTSKVDDPDFDPYE